MEETFKIPSEVESIMKIGGTAGSLFSIGLSIYGSIETSKYRHEVLSKLDEILKGQQNIEIDINEVLVSEQINELKDLVDTTTLNSLINRATENLSKGYHSSDAQFKNFFSDVAKTLSADKVTKSYAIFLYDLLDNIYVILTPGSRKDTKTSSLGLQPLGNKTLMEYASDYYSDKHSRGTLDSNVPQYLMAYYANVVSIIVKALQLLHYAEKDPSLSADDKTEAKNRFIAQRNAWYSTHQAPDPTAFPDAADRIKCPPRIQEIANLIQGILDDLGSNACSWGEGQVRSYDENLTTNYGYISYDAISAPAGKVIVGCDLASIPYEDHTANAIRIYYGSIDPTTGYIDPSTIGSNVPAASDCKNDNHWIAYQKAGIISDEKTWATTEMQAAKPIRVKFQTFNGDTDEAIIYWGIIELRLSRGSCDSKDGDDTYYYLTLHSKIKPIVFYNNRHILLNIIYNGGTNDRKSLDYDYWHTVRSCYCNDPQFDTGGPSQGSLLQPMTKAKFQVYSEHQNTVFIETESVLDIRSINGQYDSDTFVEATVTNVNQMYNKDGSPSDNFFSALVETAIMYYDHDDMAFDIAYDS